MDMIPGHPLETFLLDQRPKFGESSVDDSGIERWVCDFGEQFFGIDHFHGMALGGSNELVMLPLLDFEALLIVVIDDVPDSLLVDVLAPLPPQELQYLLEGDVTAGLNGESFLNCTVSENPGERFGDLSITSSPLSSVFSSMHNSFIIELSRPKH